MFAFASLWAMSKSAEYYRDVLGFSFNRYWGEPPCFVMLERDGVQFFLSGNGTKRYVRPNRMAHPDFRWDAYLNNNCPGGGTIASTKGGAPKSRENRSDILRNEGIRVEGLER